MPIYAFKNGTAEERGTPFAANTMNPLISLQSFKLLYQGSQIDAKAGAGMTENDLSLYNFAVRFTATGVMVISRAELVLAKKGAGQDLVVEIRDSDFNPDGSSDGELLKIIVIPKEFIPETASTWYIPLNLSGLAAGNNYWLIAKKAGDATDHNVIIGEASQDASHPCYRRSGSAGAWTANNAIHFAVYSGLSGDVVHEIYGENGIATYTFVGEDLDKVYLYIPPADGPDGGIREILELTITDDYLDKGVVV